MTNKLIMILFFLLGISFLFIYQLFTTQNAILDLLEIIVDALNL